MTSCETICLTVGFCWASLMLNIRYAVKKCKSVKVKKFVTVGVEVNDDVQP